MIIRGQAGCEWGLFFRKGVVCFSALHFSGIELTEFLSAEIRVLRVIRVQ
jgi:hypothetical protein